MNTIAIRHAAHRDQSRGSFDTPSLTRSDRERRGEVRPPPSVDQVLHDSFPASDPPSWTGAIACLAPTERYHRQLLDRIRAEYIEMPGLCLTLEQAQRLWSLEAPQCEVLLNSLLASRFLRRNDRGLFVLYKSR